MKQPINETKAILGIETSCDETAVGIVNEQGNILANIILSQLEDHRDHGGVVPEIAARAHMRYIDTLIDRALEQANYNLNDLSAIAATCGPGLIGGVMVGMMAGKSLAAACDLPFIAINHLEAHLLTARLTDQIKFPYMVLLVSGGHTQILVAHDIGHYQRLGTTLDDALGECFDKCAKMMGLGYPGGPALEKLAAQCDDPQLALAQFPLPRPMKGRTECDFSFSGLKTAVRQYIDKNIEKTTSPSGNQHWLDPVTMARLAYAFQHTVCDILIDRCKTAMDSMHKMDLVVCGGVAANKTICHALDKFAAEQKITVIAPPLNLCGDNGVMIAWAGMEHFKRGHVHDLDFAARPRWPLDQSAPAKIGAGVKA